MTEIDLHAAAHTYLALLRTANLELPRHPAPGHTLATAQGAAALTAAELMWHALTGLEGQPAVDYAEALVRE